MKIHHYLLALLVSIFMTSCFSSPDNITADVYFLHFKHDSLAQYVPYTKISDWIFTDCSTGGERDAYPGTMGSFGVRINTICSNDFLYQCDNGMFLGYPYNLSPYNISNRVLNIKWEDACQSEMANVDTLVFSYPYDFCVSMHPKVLKKFMKRYSGDKEFRSGQQIQEVVNEMIKRKEFFPHTSIAFRLSEDDDMSVFTYQDYIDCVQNGILDKQYHFDIILNP